METISPRTAPPRDIRCRQKLSLLPRNAKPPWYSLPRVAPRTTRSAFHHFPLSNFRYFLTLFPKFFSSFPHGTCSLSVSGGYLALEEAYLPLSAAIPNNTTQRNPTVRAELWGVYGVLTLYDAQFQNDLPPGPHWPSSSVYNALPQAARLLNLSFSRFTRRY